MAEAKQFSNATHLNTGVSPKIIVDKQRKITKEQWTIGSYWRSDNGRTVGSSEACLVGWMVLRYKGPEYAEVNGKIIDILGSEGKEVFNDRSTFEEVLDLLRKADV